MDKVTEILIERILNTAQSDNILFWERPQYFFNSFNYCTRKPYRGINRWLLPFGEYMTFRQFNELNKSLGSRYSLNEDNIIYEIVFFKKQVEKEISQYDIPQEILNELISSPNVVVKTKQGSYLYKDGLYYSVYSFRRYSTVFDRKYCIDENGTPLPSRLETKEVEICMEEPYTVINNYISKNSIILEHPITNNPAYYSPSEDLISIPNIKQYKSEGYYISSHFHEMAHSTGLQNRLNRPLLSKSNKLDFEEELIAEITASMLCGETGVIDFETSNSREFENHTAYIQHYINALKHTSMT